MTLLLTSRRLGSFILLLGLCMTVGCLAPLANSDAPATNVILFIGDGMGPEQVRAGTMFRGRELGFDEWPVQGEVTTFSANSRITDSAAAATAMATGHKVKNGVVSVASPGDGAPCETLLERFQKVGKKVGLVTTTHMTHATPACFGAHEASRKRYKQIAADYLTESRPNVMLGGGGAGMTATGAVSAGYVVVTNRAELAQAVAAEADMLSGQFGSGHMPYEQDGLGDFPHLHEMTSAALALLEDAPKGFFLMVEGGRIDHAGHANDIGKCVREVVAFDEAAQVAIDWAKGRRDTIIVLTADHETGGLSVIADNGAGENPAVEWSSKGHTGTNVCVCAWGVGAALFSGTIDNTDIHHLLLSRCGLQPVPVAP